MTPKNGDMYGQGGAVAIYWPDMHPCGPEPARAGKPWVVLTQDGGVTYAPKLRDDGPPAPFLGNMGCDRNTAGTCRPGSSPQVNGRRRSTMASTGDRVSSMHAPASARQAVDSRAYGPREQ